MTVALPRVLSVPRDEFLAHRWAYRAGDHVTLLGPTQNGKTTLAFELLDRTAHGKMPATVLVMKPRDRVIGPLVKAVGYRIIRSWPPIVQPWDLRPRGYALWPRHSFDPDIDDHRLSVEFRKAIRANYKRGNSIVFADEVMGLHKELGLTRDLNAVWSRGAGMGSALWVASQRPRDIPLMAYSQAMHVFLSYTPDKEDRDRYSEIGGVNPDIVKRVAVELPRFHWLYIRRADRTMCVVEG